MCRYKSKEFNLVADVKSAFKIERTCHVGVNGVCVVVVSRILNLQNGFELVGPFKLNINFLNYNCYLMDKNAYIPCHENIVINSRHFLKL